MSQPWERSEREGSVVTERHEQLREPPLYKVLLHNDDFTTMEFVVMVLKTVFQKSPVAATEIMLSVHKTGIGVAGIYTREVAETKVATVRELAKQNEHPLRCTMEKA